MCSFSTASEDILFHRAADEMLEEAVALGDKQTRRVLQLQRAVAKTRQTLAACLLRSSLAARGRAACTQVLHRWRHQMDLAARQRAAADAKSARDGAGRAREAARTSET